MSTYHAALMDASTGVKQSYAFQAPADLFHLSAADIVDRFIDTLGSYGGGLGPLFYELDSAVMKRDPQVVMATGFFDIGPAGMPFAVMISSQFAGRL
ncbi:MAG: hypothetical protein JWN94_4702 [Betaproteobacteria bacterium]|nr:hypothetical protein [Betaproteobacteria bacterium]